MGWKVREDFVDHERLDPAIGVAPPKATTLYRQTGEIDGQPLYGDSRIFFAGTDVPDEYMLDSIIERFNDGDVPTMATFEYVDDGDGVDPWDKIVKKLSTSHLDAQIEKRSITVVGTGANGNATRKDKQQALIAAGPPAARQDAVDAHGAPSITVGPGNPFSTAVE